MVEQMKPGSVVVDLAAETGGNVQGSVPGKVVRIGHAQVWGGENVPSQMPGPASKLYAQNLVNLLTLMTVEGQFAPDFEDEVVAGAAVTHAGRIVHEPTREAIEGSAESAPPTAGGFETVADAPSSTTGSADQQLDLPFDQEADQ
jgi:NAD(P) transhydrogenase subunit alpha